MPVRVEVDLDPGLQCPEAELLQPRRLRLREGLERDVGERVPAPEGKRAVWIAVGEELLEAVHVELARLDADEVAGRARHDPVGAERLPERVHVHLERTAGARWRCLAPDAVDQPVGRHGLVRVEQEERQKRARARSAERDRRAVVPGHLQRPEQPELQPLQTLLKPSLSGS